MLDAGKERGVMIPQDMEKSELTKAETDIAEWERRVAYQRERLRVFAFYPRIDRELAGQILVTLEAALMLAYARRDRLLGVELLSATHRNMTGPQPGLLSLT